MDRGTYIAASGGFAQLLKLQIVSNNLANVSTPGFKREILRGDVQTFEQTLASQIAPNDPYARGDQERTPGVVSVHAETDFAQGPIQDTGNPLDVALRNPKDFFVVLTPNGPRYTRAGNFTLGQNGQLVTADGMPVSGDGGAITVGTGAVSIAENGTVLSGNQQVGRLQVVNIAEPKDLIREGGSRFAVRPTQPQPVAVEAQVAPRALEQANVSAITSMIDLIGAHRAFEMFTKTAQTVDRMNQSAINEVGRR